MNDEGKSREQLIEELAEMRERIAGLEAPEAGGERAEEALRRQAELLRRTFDCITDAIFILDAEIPPKIVACNGAASELFGYDRTEMLGRTSDFLHVDSESLRTFQSLLYPAVEAGQLPFHIPEFRMKHKDGSLFFSEHSISQLLDGEGRRTGWVSVVRDITERRLVDEALQEGERRYRTIVEDMPALICRFLPDGELSFVNDAYCRYFDKKREDLVGHSFFQFIPREDHGAVKAHFGALSDESPAVTYEHQVVAPDGTVRHQRWTDRALFDGEGTLVEYQSIGTDITEHRQAEEALKESEEMFRTLAEESPNMIFLNLRGRVVYANSRCEEVVGYSREEFYASDFDLLKLIVPESRALIRRNFRTHMEGREIGPCEYGLITRDGEQLDAIITTKLINYRGEEAILGIVTDITERKRMERELVRLERLRALGEMSAGVSHNLNNILTGILGPAQLIQMRADDPGMLREQAAAIFTSAMRARDLVRRLHQSVKEGEEGVLKPTPVNEAVREAIQAARPRWKDDSESRGVSIEVVTALEDVPPIRGTQSGIHDMLLNLVFNAVDAMPGGGTLTIRTQAGEDGVRMIVTDTGVGMDEETRRRVFEPFFTTKAEVGTGLGLSTVYGTVSRWGGEVEVESEPGKGTTFALLLPLWTDTVDE